MVFLLREPQKLFFKNREPMILYSLNIADITAVLLANFRLRN